MKVEKAEKKSSEQEKRAFKNPMSEPFVDDGQLGSQTQVKDFLGNSECPFEIVPNDAAAVSVYEQFEAEWTDQWRSLYGVIPDPTSFHTQILALDGITYLAGSENLRSGPWVGQQAPYIGVRLKNQAAME